MRLENKVALITGGASGFGEATATLFAREKAKVVIADINGVKGEEVARKINQEGGDCTFVQTDVSKMADVRRMVDAPVDRYKKLDILFNNAGIPIVKMEFEEIGEDQWDKIMNVNLRSMFLCSKCAVPLMRKQGGGAIINTASVGGVRPRGGHLPYSVSKGAVIAFTRALALDVAPYKIRVNSISPVGADTPLWRNFTPDADFAEKRKKIAATIPLGRLSDPIDVAYAALFLASDESSMITGINLGVDGGRGI